MGGMKIYLLLILNIIINKPTPGFASIDFVNKTNQAVVGATDLHFETINRKVENKALLAWWLNILHIKHLNILYAYCDFATYTLSQYGNVPINNTDYLQAASCENYNTTHFKSMVIVGPIPANTSRISFEIGNYYDDNAVRFNEILTSTYCPNLTKSGYLNVYNANNAVYNQQARFGCSQGELYDGSSINPVYYRTCQFNATWSGEIPECRLVGPISLSKVMFETVENGKPLMVYLNFTASPAINNNTTLLTKLSSASNITPVNSTRYKIVNWSSYHQAMEWNIDNFTNEYEGQYIFTAWSTVATQVLVKSFELKVDSSSTIPVTTTTSSCHCECKTDNESSIGLTVGIIVAVVLVIVVVGVAVFVVNRKLHNQSDSNKPNYKEPSIYENQPASSTDIESKYEKIVPSSGQKELHEDPMPTYANTQNTYQNIKPNN